jgi:hypothetical protein
LGTALGSYKILGKAEAFITVGKDGSNSTTLSIYYTFADKYQWKESAGAAVDEFADHKMRLLEKIAAKPFYIRAYFEEHFSGKNGDLSQNGETRDSRGDWYGESLKNPEPRPTNGYAIPENEKNNKVHDHRGEN